MNKKVSIILSTYNEATVIKDTIEQIFLNLESVEVILVDDNSTDGTVEIVKKINNPDIKIYTRQTRGLGSAFLLGLINTSSNTVGWLDSNMGNLAQRLPEMLQLLDVNDMVILSRYVKGGQDLRSKQRVLSSKMINFFCRLILTNKIKDYTSSIFLMKRSVLLSSVPIATGHGEFFIEFIYKAYKGGKKIVEIPYTHPPDIEGMSKTASSFFRFIYLGFGYLIRVIQSLFMRN
jgi:dolichol-phosphate mannosyltransferase